MQELGAVRSLHMLPTQSCAKPQVQCQAGGLGVRGAMTALGAQRLGAAGTLRALYAGCGPTVACSALIGAVYLCSFYHTRRWAAGHAHTLDAAPVVAWCAQNTRGSHGCTPVLALS